MRKIRRLTTLRNYAWRGKIEFICRGWHSHKSSNRNNLYTMFLGCSNWSLCVQDNWITVCFELQFRDFFCVSFMAKRAHNCTPKRIWSEKLARCQGSFAAHIRLQIFLRLAWCWFTSMETKALHKHEIVTARTFAKINYAQNVKFTFFTGTRNIKRRSKI